MNNREIRAAWKYHDGTKHSTRAFDETASITLDQLSTILDSATRGLPADFLEPPVTQLNDLYLIVHSVQGLKLGAYFFQRERNTSR